MTWAHRLKRVFHIDIENFRACGGVVRIIACIEDPTVIDKILTDLEKKEHLGRSPAVAAEPRAATGRLVLLKYRHAQPNREKKGRGFPLPSVQAWLRNCA